MWDDAGQEFGEGQVQARTRSPTSCSAAQPSFSFRVTVKQAGPKLRLDAFLAAQIAADMAAAPVKAAAALQFQIPGSAGSRQDVSRAKIQASIAAGLVLVNGRPASKASLQLRRGDLVACTLQPAPPMQAVPEDIPLDVKYEDEHLMVVNKARTRSPTSCSAAQPSFSFRVTVKQAGPKLRLDAFLAAQIAADMAAAPVKAAAALQFQIPGSAGSRQDVSRAKIQASIAAGLVLVNGRPASKASLQLRRGDLVACTLQPAPPMQAVPEDIPLDVKYEDEHLMVVNKVRHGGQATRGGARHSTAGAAPRSRHSTAGTARVRRRSDRPAGGIPASMRGDDEDEGGLLGGLGALADVASPGLAPAAAAASASLPSPALLSAGADGSSSSGAGGGGGSGGGGVLRPGIVHRLDRGTSGLLVVAKTEAALTRLQAQFKARTVDRLYVSVTVGCPAASSGRVEANVVRDPRDRKRMAAAPYGSGRGRMAASGYVVQQELAGGGAALVQWKLDTGRTHQIRVHAKHIGHPLLADDTYGGAGTAAVAAVARRGWPAEQVQSVVEELGRPALHALTLAFTHPVTGQRLAFQQPPPQDFERVVRRLQGQ
ncbi:RNA pseudourine synthase 2, chloroplastic [Tetrabaena socialis]|uniref:RNA pseudourine synthase 2, chloroplastic n=1 Tax=Tetrabaena socialis TaxID=47790 RepID=A0A2J7ZP12_9CHLO|nr:RNA pseudourine synthase 2, chloroplastic [Tetrabaena socialis]|eukprot:PNH02009.1 RNA pseudourine synthase 2, chloroplastic [Tetrabaena socialis]